MLHVFIEQALPGLQPLGHKVDDPGVGLVADHQVQVVDLAPLRRYQLADGPLHHFSGKAEHRLALHVDGGLLRPGALDPDALAVPPGAEHGVPPGAVLPGDHRRPGSVAEEDAGVPVCVVQHPADDLRPHHKGIGPGGIGHLADVIKGADVFIGVSAPGTVTEEMVKTMAPNPILFPMANPVPEIMPDLAKEAGAAVVGTGRSDFPNQINNVLAFPGIFRGALDVRASDINDEMKVAAAYAIADLIPDNEITADYIIPNPFDERVAKAVAKAVAEAARKTGVARI